MRNRVIKTIFCATAWLAWYFYAVCAGRRQRGEGEEMTFWNRGLFLAGLILATCTEGYAQDTYPSRPVYIVVGYPAGGTTDIVARLIAKWLSERLGQPYIVENKPGAGSNLAAENVINSPPDGHRLMLSSASNAVNQTLYRKINFNFARDTVPIAGVVRVPNVMVVGPDVPAKTVAEFISYAKSNPDKINLATTGSNLSGAMFMSMTGVKILEVSYRGSAPALTDLLAGRTQAMFDNLPTAFPHVKAGKLRALAVTTSVRSALLPGIPTVGDTVPGYESSAWFGLSAPKNTPPKSSRRSIAKSIPRCRIRRF
jgi:tripartite-type tricarboxylate transporter receptor subunit TctC